MINELDFDTKRFLQEPEVTDMLEYLDEFAGHLETIMQHRMIMYLTTSDGSGAFRVIEHLKGKYKTQVQIEDCRGRKFSDVLVSIMKGFHFGTRTLDLSKALPFNMIQGLLYFLDQKNFRTLLVFKNFHAFRLPEMQEAVSCLSRLKGRAGIVLHLTNDASLKLTNHKDSSLKNFFQTTPHHEVRNLSIPELARFCTQSGILNEKVIKGLTETQPELEVLLNSLASLREELKKKLKIKP
jgi:hypothetical protein